MCIPLSLCQAIVRRIRLIAVVLLSSIQLVVGQSEYYTDVQHYTSADGLSYNHVIQVFEDHRGFIWTITVNGLNLYDGTKFRTVQSWPIKYQYSQLKICTEDKQGNLWIKFVEPDGSIRFLLINTTSRSVRQPQDVYGKNLPAQIIDASTAFDGSLLLSDEAGGIWKYTYDRPAQRIYRSATMALEFSAGRQPSEYIWLLDATPHPNNHSVVSAIDARGNEVVRRRIDPLENWHALPNGSMQYVQCGEVGVLSPNGSEQLYPYGALLPFENPPVLLPASADYNPRTGQLWMMTSKGLRVLDYSAGKIIPLSYIKKPFSVTSCLDVFIDSRNLVWIATFNGLYRLTPTNRRFKRLNWINPETGLDILQNASRGMTETNDGSVLMLSGNKVLRYSPGSHQLTTLFEHVSYYSILEDSPGTYWLGISALAKYNIATKKLVEYKKNGLRFLEGVIWSMYKQGKRLWIGQETGLMYLDNDDNEIQVFEQYNSFSALKGADIYQILPVEKSELLWLVTSRGLFQLHPSKGIVARYWNGGKGQYYLPAENIRHMIQLRDGTYWRASTNGLIRWKKDQGVYNVYNQKKGMHNANFYAVYADDYGFLWISSDLGIIQFQISTARHRVFLENEGISHNEFNRISHLQGGDGSLYFGSLNGITVFHPADFVKDFDDKQHYTVHLIDATFFENAKEGSQPGDILKGFASNKQIQLDYAAQYLELQFAVPHTTATTPIVYYYQITTKNHYDDNRWITTTSSSIPLTGLPYGEQILLVKAAIGLESENSAILEIPIFVPTPYYLRGWFLLLVVALITLAVWLAFRYRMHQLLVYQKELQQEVDVRTQTIMQDKVLIEQQSKQLQKQAQEKMRFFTNVTHEFRTPLSLISGPINKLLHTQKFDSQEAELLHIAYQNSQQLVDFVTQLSYLTSAENNQLKVHYEPILIYSFLQDKMRQYELLATSKNLLFHYQINVNPAVYLQADVKNLNLITNNLISNALKFTPKRKKIFFTATYASDNLLITVKDEGRGIPEDDLPYIFDRYFQSQQANAPIEGGTGIGLALVRELTLALNGRITVKSSVDQGSTFELSLPFSLARPEAVRDASGENLSTAHCPEDVQADEPIGLTVSPPEGKNKFSLLLAEDNHYFHQYIRIILEEYFDIHACSNGQEALDYLLHAESPDLLITDLMMPEVDGLQLLREIRSKPEWAHIPVLMLTARSLFQDQEQAFTLGVDDYITKPFQESEIIASINNLLERKLVRDTEGSLYARHEYDIRQQLLVEDKQWLIELEAATLDNIDKIDFTVNQLAKLMLMSRTLFYQKTRELTGMTPSQYILEARLQQARKLLESGTGIPFKKVTQAVGLKDDRHFLKIYKQRFGKSPLDYT